MVHETLAYDLFRAMGVPAPRTGYAFTRLNGEVIGVQADIETYDDVSLPRMFDSTQHLYEADTPGVDVVPGGAGEFEVDEGDDEDLGDLEALIEEANDSAGDWSDGMASVADLEEMTRMWAVERYVGHWDGYAGVVAPFRPNNYYLHSDDLGIFEMAPWGTDQTWGDDFEFDEPAGGLLFNECIADASCRAEYDDALEQVQSVASGLELAVKAERYADLLAPCQALEAAPRREYTAQEIEEGVESTLEFIGSRPDQLAEYLEDPAPPLGPGGPSPETEEPCSPEPKQPVDGAPRQGRQWRGLASRASDRAPVRHDSRRRQPYLYPSSRRRVPGPPLRQCASGWAATGVWPAGGRRPSRPPGRSSSTAASRDGRVISAMSVAAPTRAGWLRGRGRSGGHRYSAPHASRKGLPRDGIRRSPRRPRPRPSRAPCRRHRAADVRRDRLHGRRQHGGRRDQGRPDGPTRPRRRRARPDRAPHPADGLHRDAERRTWSTSTRAAPRPTRTSAPGSTPAPTSPPRCRRSSGRTRLPVIAGGTSGSGCVHGSRPQRSSARQR